MPDEYNSTFFVLGGLQYEGGEGGSEAGGKEGGEEGEAGAHCHRVAVYADLAPGPAEGAKSLPGA